MPSKKTLNAKNLAALGAERLAELLLDVTKGNAAAKRRLRLELAGEESAAEMAREVSKRLSTIDRSTSFVDWHGRAALLTDLETQRRAIVDRIGRTDPATAFDLIWRLLSLTNGIYERCDDSSGRLQDFFRNIGPDVVMLAKAARPGSNDLADRVAERLPHDEWGYFSDLIAELAPVLGPSGLSRLKSMLAHGARSGRRRYTIRHALQLIADLEDDVDGYIAQHDDADKSVPTVAAGIAMRLLKAGRIEEAMTAVDAADDRRLGRIPFEWEDARIRVLEASGRPEEARSFRWDCFARTLSVDHLRAWLKPLPDFEDIEAEERAFEHALQFSDVYVSLHFLLTWPALDWAARLVLARANEIDGYHFELLAPAADLLETNHPLAATLLRRALIDFALNESRVKRYRHAARHLTECEAAATRIADFGNIPDHAAYVAGLRQIHGRKTSFWVEVGDL